MGVTRYEIPQQISRESIEQTLSELEISMMEREQEMSDMEIAIIELQGKVGA